MKIDETIYAAIAAQRLTAERVCAALPVFWATLEDEMCAQVVALGFAEAEVRPLVGRCLAQMRQRSDARFRLMLEAGAALQ